MGKEESKGVRGKFNIIRGIFFLMIALAETQCQLFYLINFLRQIYSKDELIRSSSNQSFYPIISRAMKFSNKPVQII